MSDAAIPAIAQRSRKKVEEPAPNCEAFDQVISEAFDSRNKRLRTPSRTRAIIARRKLSITVSEVFAQKLDAVARSHGMHVGEFVENKLGKMVDEQIERLVKRWSLPSPPAREALPTPDSAAA